MLQLSISRTRLEEIFRLCDRITVMKDGCYVGTYETVEMDDKKLVNLMIGRTLESYFPFRESNIGKTVLKLENIRSGKAVKDVSLEVHEGEVLGISGLVGSGRTETMRAIFGADSLDGGQIYLNNKAIKIRTPMSAVKQGIGLLPEDRKSSWCTFRYANPKQYNSHQAKRIYPDRWGLLRKSKKRPILMKW